MTLECVFESGLEKSVANVLLSTSIFGSILGVLRNFFTTLKVLIIFDYLTQNQAKSIFSKRVLQKNIIEKHRKWASIVIVVIFNLFGNRNGFVFQDKGFQENSKVDIERSHQLRFDCSEFIW